MKKIFLIAACAFTVSVSGAETKTQTKGISNTEVANIIKLSKQVNVANGVLNPNLIQPGQILTFMFQDGKTETITVSAGNTQWGIVSTKLADMQSVHGKVVNYVEPQPVSIKPEPKKSEAVVVQKSSANFWGLLLAGIVGLGVLLFFLLKRSQYKDPVTAGPAHRNGGIPYGAPNVHEIATGVFRSHYGNQNSLVENVRKCLISTPGTERRPVRFSNNTVQKMMLRKERGYEASVDGERRYILGGCANAFGLPGQHMTGEGLLIEYLENVEAPVSASTPNGTTLTANQEQLTALVQITNNLNQTMAALTANGGKLTLKAGEGFCLNIEVNAPTAHLLNGKTPVVLLDVKKETVSAS